MTEQQQAMSRGEAIARVAVLEAELAQKSLLVREMDLMFGRMLLGMRAAVIEEEHGKGAESAMVWIVNGLVGPGELPPEEETDAQAYFDREVKAIDEGMKQIMDERKALGAAHAPVERVEQEAVSYYERAHGEKSPTHGMTLGERIAHVGGRTNAAGYMEFGSVMAVSALIDHVLRDSPAPQPTPTAAQDVAGLELAAKYVEQRAEDYDRDHGLTDLATGARTYPGDGAEYMEELDNIAAGIRALAHQSGGAK